MDRMCGYIFDPLLFIPTFSNDDVVVRDDDDAQRGHDDDHSGHDAGVRDAVARDAVGRDDDGDDDDHTLAAVVHDDDDGGGAAVVVHGVRGADDGVPSAGPSGCQRDDRRGVVAALYSLLTSLKFPLLLTEALNSTS